METKNKVNQVIKHSPLAIFIALGLLATGAAGHWFYQNKIVDQKELGEEKKLSLAEIEDENKQSETGIIYLVDTCPGEKCILERAYFKRQDGSEYIFSTLEPERIDNVPNFSDFENVARVKFEAKPVMVFSFMDDLNDENIFYLTALVQGEEDINEHYTKLVKVNRKGEILSILWENSEVVDLATLGNDEEGNKMLAPNIETRLSENHLLIALEGRFGDLNEPDRLLIINTQTKAVKYLGLVAISHNWGENNFSYKKLTPVREPCIYDGGPGPCDGEETVYRPSGNYIYETLP